MVASNAHAMRGVGLVVAAALLWGTTGTAQSFAPPQLSSYWVGAFRLAVAALFFWPALWLTDRAALAAPALRALPWRGILLSGVCMCVYNLAFFAGVRATGVAVGTAAAIGSGPVWAGLIQAAVTGRAPSARWWAGTALAVGGVVVMAGVGGGGVRVTVAGVALCLAAGLSYAAFALVNQRMVAGASPGAVTATGFTLAAALAVPGAWLLAGAPQAGADDAAIVVWLGVMSTGVAYLLFSHGLKHLTGATSVVLALVEPITAFALAIVVVGERPGTAGVLGLAAVLAGLVVVVRSEMASAALASRRS